MTLSAMCILHCCHHFIIVTCHSTSTWWNRLVRRAYCDGWSFRQCVNEWQRNFNEYLLWICIPAYCTPAMVISHRFAKRKKKKRKKMRYSGKPVCNTLSAMPYLLYPLRWLHFALCEVRFAKNGASFMCRNLFIVEEACGEKFLGDSRWKFYSIMNGCKIWWGHFWK